jgi:hypothetical protein
MLTSTNFKPGMKKFFRFLSIYVLFNTAFGQTTKLIVTSVVQTDRALDKRNELFLEYRATKNQIIFTVDTVTKKVSSKKYLVETFFSVWNGDTTIKRQMKQRYKNWKHEIPNQKWERILYSLKTDIDTLQKNKTHLHTSHHYLDIQIDLITDNDTISYSKTKPFDYLTPWFSKQLGDVLNPSIDIQIAEHLPEKFIGRNELTLVLKKVLR